MTEGAARKPHSVARFANSDSSYAVAQGRIASLRDRAYMVRLAWKAADRAPLRIRIRATLVIARYTLRPLARNYYYSPLPDSDTDT